MNDILFQEIGIDTLITRLETVKTNMQNSFTECTDKLKQIDGIIWKSKSQEVLKEKKDRYISTFPEIIEELEKEISLLKLARQEFIKTENQINKSIDTNINDLI